MTLLNKGNATIEDVTKLFELSLGAIAEIKKQLDEKMTANHGIALGKAESVMTDLLALEGRLTSMADGMSASEQNQGKTAEQLSLKLMREIRRVEMLIPSIPSFAPLEQMISDMEAKIPTLPDPVILDEGAEIVEKINELDTDDDDLKIDASHIKNLPKQNVGPRGMGHPIAGQNIKVSGQVISLDIPVQPTPPSNPGLDMLWIDNS